MEKNQNDYHVSFFKPVTNRARKNRSMVLWLIVVWAIAVFGFQILLRVIEKPTPEPAYVTYSEVWESVNTGNASGEELKAFSNSVLTVLGKLYIKPEYKVALTNAFSWSILQVAGDDKERLNELVLNFEKLKEESDNILDPDYINARNLLADNISAILNIKENDPRLTVAPFSVNKELTGDFTEENKVLVAEAMPFYLIHNRSVLTDTVFLGFPFHYFFTAVFLLVLFIGLCLVYCIQTDKIERKEQNLNV